MLRILRHHKPNTVKLLYTDGKLDQISDDVRLSIAFLGEIKECQIVKLVLIIEVMD